MTSPASAVPHATSPLAGLRVLELGNFIAAPTAGRLLADFGADVIKVERPRTGDELRGWRLHAGSTSMMWRTLNRNKRCITLDLGSTVGRNLALKLVAHCDVVLENFRPGTLERWGLGPAQLEQARPGVILSRISGYGQTGPKRDRPGFGAVGEAVGGLRLLTGDPDRPPSRAGVSIGDSVAGLYAVIGILLALHEQSTAINVVDVALTDAVLSLTESVLPDYDAYGVVRPRSGGGLDQIAPSNGYQCRDGQWVVVAGNGDRAFTSLMHLIGRPDLDADPQLATDSGRWARRDELDAAIGSWCRERDLLDALDALDVAGVPAGPINAASDILHDAQFLARGMIQTFAVDDGHTTFERVAFPGVVPTMGNRLMPVRWLGPDLGAHNAEILGTLLGLTDAQLAQLTRDGVT